MLFNVDKVMKLGGKQLSGQVQSIEVEEEASIDDITDKNKKKKKNQPTGYEGATVRIEILLEETKKVTVAEMLNQLQTLFRPYGQKKAKLIRIVNSDCNARGITRVYFKKLTTTNEISGSGKKATIELLSPVFAGVKIKKKAKTGKGKKKTGKKAKTKKNAKKSPAKDTKDTKRAKNAARKIVKK